MQGASAKQTREGEGMNNLKDALMGGPGLRCYAYCAAMYCIDCGRDIIRTEWPKLANEAGEVDDLTFGDSERLPQPAFFPESDTAQHCDHCGEYLYGPKGE